jgi:hypothetical protein
MSQDLPQKVARMIGDFRGIHAIVGLIEHEMEKRIVARHAWVKLDALLELLGRLKNEYRRKFLNNNGNKVRPLESLIARLRKDLDNSPIIALRDTMAAHGLKVDLAKIDENWRFLNATTFGVLECDLAELDAELARIAGSAHVTPPVVAVDPTWTSAWRRHFGDPKVKRMVVIYPGIATADVLTIIPNANAAQDATLRAAGLATFLRQVWVMMDIIPNGSEADRLFAEILLNDYMALWELLFIGGIKNDYGSVDKSLLDHWRAAPDPWGGANALAILGQHPHPDLDTWRTHRNKVTAHAGPDIPFAEMELANWPMTPDGIITEARRVVLRFVDCARQDIRSQMLVRAPVAVPGVEELSGNQAARRWDES